jgi:ABC-type multidrug transport system permease subunit
MIMILAIAAFGFIILVSKMDENAAIVNSDPVNLSGISYTSDMYNATNSTVHGLSGIMPNFIWIVIIFMIVVVLALMALALKR